ncbi:MAG: PAS domain S-box protein [Gemmatimonadota bacterium]
MTDASSRIALPDLQALLAGIDAIVWEADPDTFRYTFVSGHPDSLLGYPVEEWLADGFWRKMLHPADRAVTEQFARTETDAGRDHLLEYRALTADGHTVRLRDQVRVVRQDGRVSRLRGVMIDITQRHREREELRETRDLLDSVLGSIDAIVYSHSLTLHERRYINPAVERIFGRPPEDFVLNPRAWLEMVHPGDRGRVQQAVEGVVAAGGLDLEYRIVRPDGSLVWLRDRARVVPGADGRPERVDGIASDVTLRKEAELALQRSEEQTRAIIDSALDAVITTDVGGRITGWNQCAVTIFGWSAGEVLGRPLEQIIVPPDQRADHLRWFRGFRDFGSSELPPRRMETQALRRDGTLFPAEVSLSPIRVGNRLTFSIFLRDISEQRQDGLALRESEARYRALINSAPDGIFTLDVEGRVVSVNPAFQIRVGRMAKDWVGQPFDPLLDPRDVADARRILDLVLRRQAVAPRFEVRLLPTSGEPFVAEITISPLVRDGAVVGVIGVARDVSERKEAEAALERYAQDLEAARLKAVEASRAKAEFLAKMSHEIRTPMNGVMGMVSLLLETELAHEQRNFAETALRSADALLTLINDILDFSRLEAGKLSLHEGPFDIGRLAHEVTTMLAPRAEERRLQVVLRVRPGVPVTVRGDSARVRQVLTNLLGNAIKFTDQGRVLVEIRTVARPGNASGIELVVEDTGIGIAEEHRRQLFTEFHQLQHSGTPRSGSGLGLAITRQLVDLMGGELSLSSVEGRGSVFTVRLPLVPVNEPTTTKAGPAEVRGIRVLVLELDVLARASLCELLESEGISPLPAGSAGEAAAIVEECQAGRPLDAAVISADRSFEDLIPLLQQPGLLGRVVLLTPSTLHGEARRRGGDAVASCLIKPAFGPAVVASIASILNQAPVRVSGVWRAPRAKGTVPALQADRPLRVLLVEDNQVNQVVAARLLEKLGCQVILADTGAAAVRLHAEADFDLVLMDLQMPVMDGFQATARILERDQATGRTVPIIAITANAMSGDRERCLEAGMDDYITKPIGLADLLQAITRTVSPRLTISAPVSALRA